MNNTVLLVALDDNHENAYEAFCTPSTLEDAFTKALKLLTKYDHVCMIDPRDYHLLESHSYTSLAPYSINISCGIHSFAEPHSKIL